MHKQEGGGRKGAGSARSKSHVESVFFRGGGERIWGGGDCAVSCQSDSVTLQVLEEHGEIYR